MPIRRFLTSCLFAIGSWLASLGGRIDHLLSTSLAGIGDMLRIAFPPDPLHIDKFINWRSSLGRAVAPFRAFLARARLHEQFSGGGFRLDTVARLA